MILRKHILLIALLLSILVPGNVFGGNDGLHFNSHSYSQKYRTTLLLNNGDPIKIGDDFKMSFQMDLRKGEPLFGNIFCIKEKDGKHIDGILAVPSEGVSKPVLVIDGKLHYINKRIFPKNNINVEISFDKKANRITYTYDGNAITVNTNLDLSNATILFGMHLNDDNYVDVVPMNVRNISISNEGKNKYFWELRQHDGNICYDKISNCPANAINGHWTFDDHVIWKKVFNYKSKGNVQVTYNPADNIFYIVDNKTVRCFNPATKETKVVTVKGGYRSMMYSNYIGYSVLGPGLYTYNVKQKLFSNFDFNSCRWSNDKQITDEPEFMNHSWAMASDTVAYMFGGYGFYKYNNELWRINPKSGDIRKINYSPKIDPRTGAASAIVGDKLYIFGGFGNASGKQELPCYYYYDLICIDLKTMKAKTLWKTEGKQQGTSFQLASEMIYDSKDNSFYAATTYEGGRIIKISINKPGFTVVTDKMHISFDYKDMAFNLYKGKDGRLYAVLDRRMNNLEHIVDIRSIDLPIQDDYETNIGNKDDEAHSKWLWLLLLIIPVGGFAVYKLRKKGSNTTVTEKEPTVSANAVHTEEIKTEDVKEELQAKDIHEEKELPQVKYYQPTGGGIYILGKFLVRDRNGEDITSLFTRRTRNLLIILLLYSERDKKGIEIRQLDEILWEGMNEEAARNNRNVYIRKLRMLLTKVGDIEIVNDKINYRINIGKDVFFDYHEALRMMARMDEEDDEETTNRTLELIFEGPLLPTYSFEWLDKFKSDYSNEVISLLTHLLNRAIDKGEYDLAMKIAETIMMHDPFNDKALATQCSILCRRQKTGIAKIVYDNFCKNYEASLGEKYGITFAEVCK